MNRELEDRLSPPVCLHAHTLHVPVVLKSRLGCGHFLGGGARDERRKTAQPVPNKLNHEGCLTLSYSTASRGLKEGEKRWEKAECFSLRLYIIREHGRTLEETHLDGKMRPHICQVLQQAAVTKERWRSFLFSLIQGRDWEYKSSNNKCFTSRNGGDFCV